MSNKKAPSAEAIIEKAKTKWLKVSEIEFLLDVASSPLPLLSKLQNTPPSGSLFLYDRNSTQNYKEDGHDWIKKTKSDKVRETHVKLSRDKLKCVAGYYAHSATRPNFHRRIYYILNEDTEKSPQKNENSNMAARFGKTENCSIALFHYLEIESKDRTVDVTMGDTTGIKTPIKEKGKLKKQKSEGNQIFSDVTLTVDEKYIDLDKKMLEIEPGNGSCLPTFEPDEVKFIQDLKFEDTAVAPKDNDIITPFSLSGMTANKIPKGVGFMNRDVEASNAQQCLNDQEMNWLKETFQSGGGT